MNLLPLMLFVSGKKIIYTQTYFNMRTTLLSQLRIKTFLIGLIPSSLSFLEQAYFLNGFEKEPILDSINAIKL